MYLQRAIQLIICIFMNVIPNRKRLIRLLRQALAEQTVRVKTWTGRWNENETDAECFFYENSATQYVSEDAADKDLDRNRSLSERKIIYFSKRTEKTLPFWKEHLVPSDSERRTRNPPLQMRRALSGGNGGSSCQMGIRKPHLTGCGAACVHEKVAIADFECPLYR